VSGLRWLASSCEDKGDPPKDSRRGLTATRWNEGADVSLTVSRVAQVGRPAGDEAQARPSRGGGASGESAPQGVVPALAGPPSL